MIAALSLRHACLLVGFGPLLSLACGSETIDLLPARASAGSSAGGSAPLTDPEGRGGASAGSDGAGASAATSGSPADPEGGAGESGGFGGCSGPGCGGFGGKAPTFGGSFGAETRCIPGTSYCTPCVRDADCGDWHCLRPDFIGICVECGSAPNQCGFEAGCDYEALRCGKSCTDSRDCDDGRVCDSKQGVCVGCLDDEDCAPDRERHRGCKKHRCVECVSNKDCDENQVCNDRSGRCE